MKYLLDTHAFLWIVEDHASLSQKARSLYLNSSHTFFISMACIWEIVIKTSLGKLLLDESMEQFVLTHVYGNDFKILDIKLEHLMALENLSYHHRDPFDRLLVAQAMVEKMSVISKDTELDAYPIKRVW